MIGLCQKCWSSGMEVTVKEGITICKKCRMKSELIWTEEDDEAVRKFKEELKEGKIKAVNVEEMFDD